MSTFRLPVLWKLAASLFAIGVLAFQAYAIPAQIFGKPIIGYYWPIIDYPMYAQARREGDHIQHEFHVEFELEEGTRVAVDQSDLKLPFFHFHRAARRLADGDRTAAETLAGLYPARVAAIRVYTLGVIVTARGAAAASPQLLGEVRLLPAEMEDPHAYP
jgi:hypothetical protein